MAENLGLDERRGVAHICRVVHITTVDSTLHYVLSGLLAYLSSVGYQVYGISADGPAVSAIETNSVHHFVVRMTRSLSPIADIKAFWQLFKLLSSEKFDIVHTHTPKANLLGQWAAYLAGASVRAATVHGLYFTPTSTPLRRIVFTLVEALSLLPAHLIFLINRQDLATVRQHHICSANKVHLLKGGMGIDLRRFAKPQRSHAELAKRRIDMGFRPEDIIVGYVGRLVREKGVIELLETFRILSCRHANLKLLMVGPYDAAKSDAVAPALAEQMGLAGRCTFTGERSDTPDLYSLMDIFVLPSHREGLPLVVMEAQAMSIPVITTDARGCIEAILDGETGIIVPVNDVQALSSALEQLIRDAATRQQMGQRGRRLAEEWFDERNMFVVTEGLYRAHWQAHAQKLAQSSQQLLRT